MNSRLILMAKMGFSVTIDENSSSTIGSSEVDEERTKVSEENPLTPSSDAIIGTNVLMHQKNEYFCNLS